MIGVELTERSVEKLAAAIAAGMVVEARYHGEETTVAEISTVIAADPDGETASYFIRAAADALDLIAKLQADPELLALFPGGAP